MENTYTLSVYNTLTARYESVCVSEEVYHVYMRTNWNIEDSNKRFYKHEIQFSSLTGGEDGAFENFDEFIDTEHTPEEELIRRHRAEAGLRGLKTLPPLMQKRFVLHYEQGMTTKRIADLQSVSEYTVKKDIVNARRRLKKYFEE